MSHSHPGNETEEGHQHSQYIVTGTYRDEDGQTKTAFMADLHYRLPETIVERADYQTCTDAARSLVKLSRDWADSKKLICGENGTLNYRCCSDAEDEKLRFDIGGKDSAGEAFKLMKDKNSDDVYLLIKRKNAQEWNAMDTVERKDIGEVHELRLRWKAVAGSKDKCTCQLLVKGSTNATKLNWILENNLD